MLSAEVAVRQLKEGNQRIVQVLQDAAGQVNYMRCVLVSDGPTPSAVISGCSYSRLPAEHAFAQGLGDLFAIRVPGNVVASSQIASVEFATVSAGARLADAHGHAQCGAILATIESIQKPEEGQSPKPAFCCRSGTFPGRTSAEIGFTVRYG